MNVFNHGGGMDANGNMNLSIGMKFNDHQAKKALDDTLNQLEQKATITTKIKIDGQNFYKTVSTYRDAIGNLIETTEYWNVTTGKAFKEITNLTSVEKQITQEEKKHAQATQQLTQSQDKLNKSAKQSTSIFQDFANTFLKMAKFNTINLIYDGLINKMSEAIEITNNFDKAMTEFKKVTDTTNLSLSEYTDTLGDYGEKVARTQTQMLESATEFSKAGFTAEDSARLAQVSSLYQNIADAELSAGESASFIISQMKAFNIEADDATSIIDKVNEVKLFVTS